MPEDGDENGALQDGCLDSEKDGDRDRENVDVRADVKGGLDE